MKKFFTGALLILAVFALNAQDYKGKLINSKTNDVIPYVNIGIIDKGIGTVSYEDGTFHLNINQSRILPSDTIVFSSLGYETLKILVKEAKVVYNEYPVIIMEPSQVNLNEVVVTNEAQYVIPETVGYSNTGEEAFGYFKDNIALGGELATRVVVKSGLRQLENFTFEVWNNPSDSLLLRVNIYDDDGRLGRPKTNLNVSGKNIIKTITKSDKMVSVDLKPYEIYVKNDFFISLELLKIYGKQELGLILAAKGAISDVNDGYGSYRKYVSQDSWERLSDLNMAYTVESSFFVKEKEYNRFIKRQAKTAVKKRYITGFAISNGKMIAGVSIFNHRTKETVETDKNGRYRIAVRSNDILSCSKNGFTTNKYRINHSPTLNIKLTSN